MTRPRNWQTFLIVKLEQINLIFFDDVPPSTTAADAAAAAPSMLGDVRVESGGRLESRIVGSPARDRLDPKSGNLKDENRKRDRGRGRGGDGGGGCWRQTEIDVTLEVDAHFGLSKNARGVFHGA